VQKIRFDKRSMFIIFLMGGMIQPAIVSAMPGVAISQQRKSVSPLQKDIAERLINKGLEDEAAYTKANKFVSSLGSDVLFKLSQLQQHQELSISKESIIDGLARRALFEQSIDCDEYASLLGFVQGIRGRPLSNQEIAALKQIVLLNRSAA
jgi:hypothetical protein